MLTDRCCLLLRGAGPRRPRDPGRALRYRVDVAAPIDAVWSAWTEGESRPGVVRARAATSSSVLSARTRSSSTRTPRPGARGAEENLVLAVQAPEMLSFTWDAPPSFPRPGEQRTSVVVRLERLGADRTRVWFEQTGWGRGGEWDETYSYFSGAWKYVLSMLHYRYAVGPVDWSASPDEPRWRSTSAE